MGTDMVELSLRLDKSGRVSLSRRHGGEGLDEPLAYLGEHTSKMGPSLSEDLGDVICSAILSNGADRVIADSLGWKDGVLASVEDVQLTCTVRLQMSDSLVVAVVEEVCREIVASEDAWGNTVIGEDVYAVGCSHVDYFYLDDDEEESDDF